MVAERFGYCIGANGAFVSTAVGDVDGEKVLRVIHELRFEIVIIRARGG